MNKAVAYAKSVVNGKVEAPKYVKIQAQDFLNVWYGKNKKYCINKANVDLMEKLLKLLNMPKGLKTGASLYDCTMGYQWLFYTAILCVVYRKNKKRRRYQTGLLEIARKNFKTYTVATVFILLFLLEPQFSKFFSVAPDGALSKEVKDAIQETLKASPSIYEFKGKSRWKILRDSITFIPKETKFTPLAYTNNKFDGKLPNVFLADEVGALPNSYAIEAMRSGQINILNKLGCIISTKYPTINNPFEDEVAYAKRVLDGIEKDDTIFALLYEPDEIIEWATDDKILLQANPVAQEISEIWDDLLKRRARAISIEHARENFLTKHCNIIYQGAGTESYIDVSDVQKCKSEEIDWTDRPVYIGVDLSMTNDNCSVAVTSVDDEDNILADVFAFIPEGRIAEKNKFEGIDYHEFIRAGKCIACGDRTVDYKVIEDFVFDLESKLHCQVMAIGYDRYNAMSSAQKWESGREVNGERQSGYNTVEIRQHSSVLHAPTKLLQEKILNQEFLYTKNNLLEINFQNARCTYDTNMNMYVNKKKSNGKVDMVVSLINAVYLLQQGYFLNQSESFDIYGI